MIRTSLLVYKMVCANEQWEGSVSQVLWERKQGSGPVCLGDDGNHQQICNWWFNKNRCRAQQTAQNKRWDWEESAGEQEMTEGGSEVSVSAWWLGQE